MAVAYASSPIATGIEAILLVLSLTTCSVFIYLAVLVGDAKTPEEANTPFTATWLLWLEFTISLCMAAEVIQQFVISSSMIGYLLRFATVADLLTIIPGVSGPFSNNYTWFFMPLRVLRFSRGLSNLKSRGVSFLQGFKGQIVFYWATVLSLAFLAAGVIFVLENGTTNKDGQVKDLLDAFYYIIISLTTVGYGDIVPKTVLGRLVTTVLVIASLAFLPGATRRFIRLLTSASNATTGAKGHVVLWCTKGSDPKPFITEFLHPDRAARDSALVIVAEEDLDAGLLEMLKQPQYSHRVEFLKGNLQSKRDMGRAKVTESVACFMLSSRTTYISDINDSSMILTGMNLRNHFEQERSSHLAMYLQLASKQHKVTAYDRGLRNVVCIQELRIRLLAQNCLFPGMFPFVANLSQTADTRSDYPHNPWLKLYDEGLGQECYTKDLAPFVGMVFSEVVSYVYLKYAVTVFAIRSSMGSVKHKTLLFNPGNEYIIQELDEAFLICKDELEAMAIDYDKDDAYATAARSLQTSIPNTKALSVAVDMAGLVRSDSAAPVVSELERTAEKNKKKATKHAEEHEEEGKRPKKHKKRSSTGGEDDKSIEMKPAKKSKAKPKEEDEAQPEATGKKHKKKHKKKDEVEEPTKELEADTELLGKTPGKTKKKRKSREVDEPVGHKGLAEVREIKKGDEEASCNSQRDEPLPQNVSKDSDEKGKVRFKDKHETVSIASSAGDAPKSPAAFKRHVPARKGTLMNILSASTMVDTNMAEMFIDPTIAEKYLTLPAPASPEHAIFDSVEGLVEDHIVICGLDESVPDLLLRLRDKVLSPLNLIRPVVVLCPDIPTQVIWNRISFLPEVYFVKGQPNIPRDIKRTGVATAARVIILTTHTGTATQQYTSSSQPDAKSVLSFRMIRQMTNADITVELVYEENIRFLMQSSPILYMDKPNKSSPKADQEKYKEVKEKFNEIKHAGINRNPYYAAGNIFVASFMDNLLCNLYFNADFLKIVEVLVDPESTTLVPFKALLGKQPFAETDKVYTAGDVFTFLVQAKSYIVLSYLRKGNGSLGRYVHTCPGPDEPLMANDHILVLRNTKRIKQSAHLVFSAQMDTGIKAKASAHLNLS